MGFIVEDAQLRFLVAQSDVTDSLPPHSAHVLLLDKDAETLSRAPVSNPARAAFSSNLAYLIYTSGSTGRPKGVSIEHRNAVSFLFWARSVFSPELLSGLLASTSIAFDLSVFELFLPLSLGGTVILAGNALELPNLPAAQRVSLVNTVPSAISELLRSGGLPSSVRVVNLAGEPLATSLVQQLYLQPGLSLVYDLYGPSETTTYSTFTLRHSDKPATIGRPISGTQVYLLDAHLQPVPTGVPGEVFISGAGVSRGYLGRPELTADRFVPDPFSATPGARMYRTGDLARYRADGNLEYLGRTDFQVKVRGFRIELGEIETVLDKHPGVRQVVVVAREDRPGDKRLVAYLTPSGQQAPTTAELRAHLKQHLPEYMVPSAFVVLEQLPLTPNGKVNRKALPAPEASTDSATEYIAPRTPTEEQLAAIWAEVLSVPRIGAEDNFFELGGHSLLATRVLSRVRSAFQVELPVRALFEAPTLSALALKLDEAQRTQSSVQALPRISAARIGDIPLAFSQQRLWFLDQLEPGSPVYNLPSALRLSGALNTEALRHAFEELVRRHESLRTTFSARDGQPIQVIAPSLSLPLEMVDLRNMPASSREDWARELIHREALRPFNLATGPLLRATLLSLDTDEHVLVFVMHHIVSDGWSMGVLVREVAALYAAFASGRQPALDPLSTQYPDFALWQRSWLQGEVLDSQLRYWKQQLSGAPAHLELPTDKPRPPVQTFRGDNLPVALPKGLSESIKALSMRLGVTPFMTLLAGFQVLLHRYSRQDDISVGSPIAGRRRTELEGLIGFFVNTLVFRSRIASEATFRELLLQVRDTTLAAYEHQDLPFEKLVEELQPQRDLSRSPFFQVMFVLQNTPAETLTLPGLTLRPVEQPSGTSKFDWTLSLIDTPSGFSGGLEYNTDLFERDTVARAMEHLRTLLEAAVAHPEARLSELPLLSDAEQHKLLVEFNGPSADYPREATLHQLIEAQVERTPDAVALTFEGQSLTYRELDSRANQLAWYLRSLGVGPESRVGLCLERSLEMVIALLATHKAGGAYVPLDPAYPQERLGWMLEDARPTVLLVQERLLPVLPARSARVVCLDSGWAEISAQPRHAPAPLATANNLAYIIFTSGSTGRPKGAMNEHHAVVNRLLWMQDEYKLGAQDVVLQKTPFSFDVSVWEFFWPLMQGARLVLARPGGHQDPNYLASLIAQERVTTLHFVPSMLKVFLEEPHLEARCVSLRRVVCSGEALPVEFQDQCLQRLPQAELHNLYGPTEAAVDVTYYACKPSKALRSVPIGRPVANTQIRILDASLRPVPVGVSGELYIGGVQVGRGYQSRPDLTAERFIPDPFNGRPGARMYRTGDVARWLPDGNIEYLGRADFQVKIRGLRIELGEIEAHLAQHPAVRQAVVIAREDRPGDKRLVAYVVASPEQASAAELRAFLQPRLPEHMVPSAFVCLEQFPLSPNGKLERRALPAPETTASKAEYIAPRTPTEEQLAAIWAEVLSVPRVGAEDHFFELGGHSLMATQVISRVRSAFQVELPVRALFEAPTLSALARKLDEARGKQGQDVRRTPAAVRSSPPGAEQPLSFAQQRLWFLDQFEPGSAFYNLPAALRLSGKVDTEALRRAFAELVRRHESLRTTFNTRDGQPVQVIAPALSLPLEVVDLQDVPTSERETRAQQWVLQETQRPFDLANGPLLRTSLLRLNSEDHVLVLVMHHIVSDGWSMGVLVREVAALYAAFAAGRQPSLPALPVQYADFALWQRSWLQGEALDTQLRYWRQQLSGAPALLELPTDKPRPAVRGHRGALHTFRLPPSLAAALNATSTQHGVSLFMTLLAGFQVLLHRYSGQDDLSIGSPIAGRRSTELEGLIGFFVNTLVLRSRFSPHTTFRELLRQVRDTTLSAYEHQDVPFEKLVEELSPQRSLGHSPLFQVMFSLQNTPSEELRLPGLTLRPVDFDVSTAKFDLSLALSEGPQGLTGFLTYNTDLFEADTVVRMMRHYLVLLEALTSRPDTALRDLPLLSSEERQQVLVAWNDTRADFPREATLHSLVQAQASRTPDSVAIEFEGAHLTYRQLDSRANQLAHHLRTLGVGPGTRVALCFERSPELLVSLLATLHAGAAWVPLDPEYPRERLEFMLQDCGASLLLTRSSLLEALPSTHVHVLRVDSLDALDALPQGTTPLPTPVADSPAYVIYTSGSTGRPKGVQVAHRAAANHLHWRQQHFPMGPQDAFLQKASFSFDISVWEMFAPLVAGARLVLARPGGQRDSEYLVQAVVRHSITHLHFGPSPLSAFLQTPGVEHCRSLRFVFCGGEPLTSELHSRFISTLSAQLVHQYGPTETCIDSTAWVSPSHPVSSLPIGRPISNTQVYVLDERLQPVPTGVPGELLIGGTSLAWGYLNRPELTAEKFIPNPFAPVPGERLYRTGDKVRWLADGTLEFLGRLDFQVKVRGFRIELGEIESVLARHPSVRQSLVIAREDRPGDKRLVAYVVPSQPQQSSAVTELRAYLKAHLPEYMVPSAFVALEQLPLTPNGKVNRKALPAPESSVSDAVYIAPRTPTEELLADIWAKVLGVPRVGAEDHFFELGGHSLLATQVISRLRSVFRVELPVRALFEAPTLSSLARRIDEARSQQSRNVMRAPPLRATPRTGDIPLAFTQQRLWFLDQLEPGSPVYNIPAALRLSGKVDTEALHRAFEELVRRHESLRTLFVTRDGQPVQLIAPFISVPLEVVDLEDVPASEREARAQKLAHQEALRPFDLARGPLLRTSLLRLGTNDHVLLVTLHHIISDGWSTGVLVREVASLYAAFAAGQQPLLPPLPVQYADFALWQRSWLQGEALDAQLRYWRQQLSGAPALLELPTDKPRPAIRSHRGALHTFRLPPSLSQALATTSTQHGVSLFMTLLAGFQVLLHRYSGQDDLSVGSPIAGRRSTELEGLIGFFVNTLVLRSRFSSGMSFRDLLRQVRDTTLSAYEHQDVPFEKLVEELSPQRSLGHSPLFQVSFSLQNTPSEELRLPGLTLRPVDFDVSTAKFDLSLALSEGPQGLTGFLTYNTDLFEADTVARMMRHYLVLLEALTSRPDTALRDLPLLSSEERQQVLVAWNDTRADFPREATLHSLVQAQASRTPDSVAIEFEDAHLTYRQLSEASTRLAHHLRTLGVGPGTRVALCFERSPELLVSLLATLHAGAAWVPLDPEYPRERLEFMLQDCGATLLLTRSSLLEALPSTHVHVLRVDSLDALDALPQGTTPLPTPVADSPAYVIYTSGSTGRPKGVQVAHRAAVNHLHWRQQHFPMGPQDAFLQKASFSFDISVWEMFAPLVAGARLVLARPGGQRDSEYLVQAVVRHSITHLHFGPSPLSAFLQTPGVEHCRSLRFVFCGGEPLTSELHSRFISTLSAQLVHQYGPTETCIDSTAWVSPSHPVSSLPIGRPISNTQVYVLDERLQPVPTGVPGELLIGGTGLAWGYLNRPELTAEKFIPHPFSDAPGARLYRTGDKVRWLADGTLEFLGRLDFQVKVRGFRIELGEIESVLARHPSVRQSLVIAREDRPGDKRLVAYVVPSQPQQSSAVTELRAYLKEHLPEYMVPSAFVALEQLPLTPNGKVNRKALPAPESSVSDAAYIAPRTPTEQQLATIWAEVLGVPRVGAEDHFFELGGHSLLATRVFSRLRSTFEVELPVRALFEAPTLSSLARRIDEARSQQSRSVMQAPPLRPAPRTGDIPLAFAQQRLWFLDQLEPGSPVYNIPAALRLSGKVDTEALHRAFEELVRRHESLRTTFASHDGEPIQLIAPALSIALDIQDLRDLPVAERESRAQQLAHQEAQRPFDLANGPLLRTSLLRLGTNDHVLLVTLHHIISDGWSTGVLVREVASLYAAFAAGQQPSLPPLPIQYADFALWQRSWLQGEVLEAQLRYWKQQLGDAPSYLELATDKPRPPVQTFRGDNLPVTLPRALSDAIKALSSRLGVTPFMTLLAGFQVLLHRYSGQGDISVGSPIAGRRSTEVEGLIGFFVNTLVLRSRFSADTSFRELLLQVRDTTLAAYEHQDVPFEKLVEQLQPQRDLSRTPLFQVMFVLQNAPAEALKLPELTLRPVEQSSGTSKFDWLLTLVDSPSGFSGGLQYNTDLFERDTVARAVEHLRVLLTAAVAHPETRLSELPLLSEGEQRKVLVEWNDTRVDYPRETSIHALFEAQAARTPDAIAVEFQGSHLTYRQLDSRSNQLAHHLLALGLRPGQSVALCVERSLEMVISTLAILKAGAAYVPLDPSYPRERLEFMLQDVRAPLLLAQRHLAERLPSGHARLVVLDSDAHLISQQSETSLGVAMGPEALAYVMYTSGSTGQPKGVCIPHRGVVRLVKGSRFADFGPREVMLQLAPISFDAATLELWGSLLHGGKLVVLPPHAPSIEELGRALKKHGITTLWLTAALFDQVVATQPEALSHVRQVLAGGDVLAPERVKTRLAQGGQLVNGYGPTESTTFTTCNVLTRQEQVGHTVSIGRPISNTQVYVLDAQLRPVPPGVHGELYIGGDGLAWGYLNRPELTAEKFVPHPFALTPGERLYRTGDRVRWLADGTLEFSGRLDSQVKLRGFRIELGEIESILDKHPSVRQCVVIAREDRPGDKRLVAYVVTAGQQAPAASELRAYLKEHLPEYMVPSAFVVLEQLPLTPNGKVNRKALPAPEVTASDAEYIAPRTPTEEQLAAIWAEVLGVPRVGAEDDFFQLGGHSLLATRVLSRLRSAFAVELPVRALFEASTLSALAGRIDDANARQARGAQQAPPLKSVPRTGSIPLAFSQQRLWFLDQLEPGSPVYNIPYALRLSGKVDIEALRRAFEELVRRHESLRTTFSSHDGQPIQLIAPALSVPLDILDLRDVPVAEREARAQVLARQEAQYSFDLANGPLLRTSLLRLDSEDHVLVLVMHHIISDGWSMSVLVREVASLYAAFSAGRQSTLPPLPIQYPDFALWQRSWLQGEVLDAQLHFWKQQLSGAPAHLELATDKPRPPVQTFRGDSVRVALPKALSESIKSLSMRLSVTPFMTLLAGFQVLLHRYSRQDDISVGSPIAGRRSTELEGLIGFFINTLVLRTRVSPQATFRDLLLQVRDTTLAAYEHQDLPFEKLVEELQPQRDLSRSPLFQVMFILQNAPAEALQLPGLTLRQLPQSSGTSKFDWTLAFTDTPNGFAGGLEYNVDLFERDTIVRATEHLRILLEAAVAHPETRLSELPLLSTAEKHKLLVQWNDLPLDYPREATLHELFEAQVERTPDAEALVDGTRSLTYAELNARANQLAHSLRSLGVGPETPVGICSRRSADLVVGLLGILKAGGLYVPLDPAYPASVWASSSRTPSCASSLPSPTSPTACLPTPLTCCCSTRTRRRCRAHPSATPRVRPSAATSPTSSTPRAPRAAPRASLSSTATPSHSSSGLALSSLRSSSPACSPPPPSPSTCPSSSSSSL
ncbi:amino acid adenylation domain-containing protein [Archangium violaceum]|nr:amino acid adenylation domain-containing protein [Archangium violaceum]